MYVCIYTHIYTYICTHYKLYVTFINSVLIVCSSHLMCLSSPKILFEYMYNFQSYSYVTFYILLIW